MNSLRIQRIAFRGPFYTPCKHAVSLVENHIILESELADLFGQNKLNRDLSMVGIICTTQLWVAPLALSGLRQCMVWQGVTRREVGLSAYTLCIYI